MKPMTTSRLDAAGVLSDAWALWRRDRELLVRLAGALMFLPTLAGLLFLPDAVETGAGQGANEALVAWLSDNIEWLALQQLIALFAAAVLYVLYLDGARPTIGEALRRALRILAVYVPAALLAFLAMAGGFMALVLPGAYLLGRTSVLGPVVVAERPSGPIMAIERCFARTRGHGWLLFGIQALVLFAGQLTVILFSGLDQAFAALQAASPLFALVLDGAASAVATVTTLALLLIKIAVYRRLAGSSRGM